MGRYNKFFVAFAAAFATAVSTTADQEISLNDIFVILSSLMGALAVYAVPNRASAELPPHNNQDEGQSTAAWIVIGLVVLVALVIIFGRP